jgi:GxxExxY protein
MKPETEKEVKIFYDGKKVGLHRLDLMVNDEIIVELKTVKNIDDSHISQLLSYIKATNKKVGLLLNFSKPKLEIKRVVN